MFTRRDMEFIYMLGFIMAAIYALGCMFIGDMITSVLLLFTTCILAALYIDSLYIEDVED